MCSACLVSICHRLPQGLASTTYHDSYSRCTSFACNSIIIGQSGAAIAVSELPRPRLPARRPGEALCCLGFSGSHILMYFWQSHTAAKQDKCRSPKGGHDHPHRRVCRCADAVGVPSRSPAPSAEAFEGLGRGASDLHELYIISTGLFWQNADSYTRISPKFRPCHTLSCGKQVAEEEIEAWQICGAMTNIIFRCQNLKTCQVNPPAPHLHLFLYHFQLLQRLQMVCKGFAVTSPLSHTAQHACCPRRTVLTMHLSETYARTNPYA